MTEQPLDILAPHNSSYTLGLNPIGREGLELASKEQSCWHPAQAKSIA